MTSNTVNRRTFLKSTSALAAGTAASVMTGNAASRIIGANDRINLGIVGISRRVSDGLMPNILRLSKKMNAEIIGVCDLWTVNREKGVELCRKQYERKPQSFQYLDDMLNMPDLDGVIVGTGDPQHALLLERVVQAGKDCYCEKPMAIRLEYAKRAYKAVKKSKQVVQIGTQYMSDPMSHGAKKVIQSGVLGKISKVDIHSSYWGPRWRGRDEIKHIKEKDTDWKAWLLDFPYRPFDPQLYFEYRVYRDFSTGIAGQWMSHHIAEVSMIMDVTMPESVSVMGGTYVWKDGREISDTFHGLVKYPEEFILSYSCNFGNDYPGYKRMYGLNGTIELVSGDAFQGKGGYFVSSKGGGSAPTPENEKRALGSAGTGSGATINKHRFSKEEMIEPAGGVPGDDGHMENFLDCMKTRKEPYGTILSGYVHSVVCIMAHQSDYLRKTLYWDPKYEEIVDSPPSL